LLKERIFFVKPLELAGEICYTKNSVRKKQEGENAYDAKGAF
jgi:hypothetical protein